MNRIVLGFVVVLTGCAQPTPYFGGVQKTRISVDGSTFDVRVRGDLAEAVRVNSEYAPRFGPIRARAAFAMATVSGCRVVGVLGDQAVATGRLDCGSPTQRRPLAAYPQSFTCLDVSRWVNEGPGPNYAEFECTPD